MRVVTIVQLMLRGKQRLGTQSGGGKVYNTGAVRDEKSGKHREHRELGPGNPKGSPGTHKARNKCSNHILFVNS